MAKWIFAVLVTVGASAQAHEIASREDDCAALEQVIYEEVTAASWGMTGADTSLTNFNSPGILICLRTTLAVTKAFTAAMQTVGQNVTWNIPIDPGMEACLGGDIRQCITTPGPYRPVAQLDDTWRISGAWSAVSSAVQKSMPDGSASDRSVFDRDLLRRAVRSAANGWRDAPLSTDERLVAPH